MNCQGNVNSTLPTQLPHKLSYIVAILGHNNFESPNIPRVKYFCLLEHISFWDYLQGLRRMFQNKRKAIKRKNETHF
jgi:hypothetical protein